jgi:hypothetical protein
VYGHHLPSEVRGFVDALAGRTSGAEAPEVPRATAWGASPVAPLLTRWHLRTARRLVSHWRPTAPKTCK